MGSFGRKTANNPVTLIEWHGSHTDIAALCFHWNGGICGKGKIIKYHNSNWHTTKPLLYFQIYHFYDMNENWIKVIAIDLCDLELAWREQGKNSKSKLTNISADTGLPGFSWNILLAG